MSVNAAACLAAGAGLGPREHSLTASVSPLHLSCDAAMRLLPAGGILAPSTFVPVDGMEGQQAFAPHAVLKAEQESSNSGDDGPGPNAGHDTREAHTGVVGARLRWTAELHNRFLAALAELGGPDSATPKSILSIMKVPGLSIFHIKSHLQQFRHRRAMIKLPKHQQQQGAADSGGGGGGSPMAPRRGLRASPSVASLTNLAATANCNNNNNNLLRAGSDLGISSASGGSVVTGPCSSSDGDPDPLAAATLPPLLRSGLPSWDLPPLPWDLPAMPAPAMVPGCLPGCGGVVGACGVPLGLGCGNGIGGMRSLSGLEPQTPAGWLSLSQALGMQMELKRRLQEQMEVQAQMEADLATMTRLVHVYTNTGCM